MVKVKNTIQWIRNLILYKQTTLPTLLLSILTLSYMFILYFTHSRLSTLPTIQVDIGVCNKITNPTNLTTLVIMSYTNNEALMRVLSQYNNCTKFGGIIHEIVIVWNNPKLSFDWSHTSLQIDNITHIIPINVYQQNKNSMANRWFISRHHRFKTSSAVFIDDDMYLNQYTILCMLKTFLMNEYKIIAPSRTSMKTTRQFIFDKETNEWKYKNENLPYFNMLLPGMSMFNTNYLPKLALAMEEYELLEIIDQQDAHCDDISMMLCMAMLNYGKEYLFGIEHILFEDYSHYRGNQQPLYDPSQVVSRYEKRSECLTMILNKFISHNKKKETNIINPMVAHERKSNTIDCRKCPWCDNRGCWYKEK